LSRVEIPRLVGSLTLACLGLLASGCRQDMHDQPKFEPLEATTVFADGAQALVLRDQLAGLDIAVQVIWGAEDRIIPASHAQALPEAVRVSVLQGAGHMVHMEKAAEVNALIAEVLEA